ncbi:hypothetical protein VN12_07640 [Pirellula sp. SH-Sr6A]|uniref:hypothetical protein n=1 Tax=Pirellula sp. SH-Sr6A TaxID=1632865 RepID=UPI00078BB7FC|nr:hypothetical protein [Pirellula sp. SH-Sr6A]AMV31978.1 hypothetical protein VN12_07640 [Pirellula sp. SH-Sr6A]
MVQRFVHKGAWLFLGSLLALIWAIDWPFVAAEGIESTAVASSASRFTKKYVADVRATETRQDNARSSLVLFDGPTAEWAEAKRAWYRYHRYILPIAVASFFLSFGLWSLLGVENLAVRPQK